MLVVICVRRGMLGAEARCAAPQAPGMAQLIIVPSPDGVQVVVT